jgi:putative oxidoreductase
MSNLLSLEYFKRCQGYGTIFLRLLVGSFIIWGVQDNIFNSERMEEFAAFLAARNVPYPLFSAFLSVYVQLICGVSILLGAWIRLTSIPLIINFIAAIIIAHLGDSFRDMFPALVILACGFFFLFNGAGKLSVDEMLESREGRAVGNGTR